MQNRPGGTVCGALTLAMVAAMVCLLSALSHATEHELTLEQVQTLLEKTKVWRTAARHNWSGQKVAFEQYPLPGIKGAQEDLKKAVERLFDKHDATLSSDKQQVIFATDGRELFRLKISDQGVELTEADQSKAHYPNTQRPKSGKLVQQPSRLFIGLRQSDNVTSIIAAQTGAARFGKQGLLRRSYARREFLRTGGDGESRITGQVFWNGNERGYELKPDGKVQARRRSMRTGRIYLPWF